MNKDRGIEFLSGAPDRLKRCVIEVQRIYASEIRIGVHMRSDLRTAQPEFLLDGGHPENLIGMRRLVQPTHRFNEHGTPNAAVPSFELPFMVQGPWDDPIMLPDPEIRLQRSGAAAPLLDAVRNRGASDAVRSALERFRGAPAPAPQPAAPAAQQAPALAGASAPEGVPPGEKTAPAGVPPAGEPQSQR